MALATREPAAVTAGDTVKWRREDLTVDYPATGGWALSYELQSAVQRYSFSAAASGDAFEITVAAATSAAWLPGTYAWAAYATKAAERYEVGRGTLTVRPNLAATGTIDARSQVKRVLDAIDAVLLGRASRDQESYEIAGRRLERTPIPDLLALQKFYAGQYQSELAAEGIAQGRGDGSMILTRFVR